MTIKKNKIKLTIEFTLKGETREVVDYSDTYQDSLNYIIMFTHDYEGAVITWLHYEEVVIEEEEDHWTRPDHKTWGGRPIKKMVDSNEL